MNKPRITSFIMGALMLLSSALAALATPTPVPVGKQGKLNLETIIPKQFDGWQMDTSFASPLVSPNVEGEINKIYSQTLSRTYVNDQGERVMLVIAYGRDQSVALQVHRPEVCYAASGFNISKMTKTFVNTTFGQLPVMHLIARKEDRNEPITYWIKIGNSMTRGWFEEKWATFTYELTGQVPDGLLFRVSSISNNAKDSYRIQKVFLADLLKSMRSGDRHWLIGQKRI